MATAAAQPVPRLEHLRPAQIMPHPKNPRVELGDLTELTESIRGSGVLEPLIVGPGKGRAKFTLIAGHRRHAAATKAGLKTVPCVVRDDLADERAQLEVMLTENLHRSDLNPIEEGSAYQSLLEFDDVDVKSLAARTGHKQKTIRDRIKLAQSPESVRTKLIDKQITIEDALALAEFEDDPELHARLTVHLGSPSFAYNVQHARDARAWAKESAKIAKDLQSAGTTVFATYDELVADEEASDGKYEWYEVEDEADVPEGAERCAVPTKHFDDKVQWYFKETVDPDAPAATETPADAKRREQEAARAEQAAALTAAATVRRAFTADLIKHVDEDLAVSCLRFIVMDALDGSVFDNATAAALVGLPPSSASDDDEKYTATVETFVNRLSLPQLAVAAMATFNPRQEVGLATGWGWNGRSSVEWRTALTEVLGYEWSAFELSMLAAADAARS